MNAERNLHRLDHLRAHAMEIALGVHSDQNIFQQYFEYLGNTFTGNLGVSLTFFPTSVAKVVMLALPWRLGLVRTATLIAFILGTLVASLAAWRRRGIFAAILRPVLLIIS